MKSSASPESPPAPLDGGPRSAVMGFLRGLIQWLSSASLRLFRNSGSLGKEHAKELPDEVVEDVEIYLAERQTQVNHWFFVLRTLLVFGLAAYLVIDSIVVGSTLPSVTLLMGGYVLCNVLIRFGAGSAAAAAPWAYAVLDVAFVLLLRYGFGFAAVVDPNATMIGLFSLLLICYTCYGSPSLSAALALAAVCSSIATMYLAPDPPIAQIGIAASSPSEDPLRLFLLLQYLSIASIVSCLLALRLRQQVVAYSAELYRRIKTAAARENERERRERLEELDRLKRDFITVLSHELRNPITPLVSSLNLLREDFKHGEPDPEILDLAIESTQALKHLINDYTELAQLLTRTYEDESSVNITLKRLVQTLLAREVSHATVQLDLPEDLASCSNPYLLRGAALAVLRRAALRSLPDEPIEVSGWAEGDQVVLCVHDRQSYLPPEDIRSLEDPFSPLRERIFFSKGTGLELVLAQHALRHLGGSMRIESGREKGTRVLCQLPGPSEQAPWLSDNQLQALDTS